MTTWDNDWLHVHVWRSERPYRAWCSNNTNAETGHDLPTYVDYICDACGERQTFEVKCREDTP